MTDLRQTTTDDQSQADARVAELEAERDALRGP